MPHIIGDRIILREYRKEDLGSIRKWVNDPEIVDYLSDAFLYPHSLHNTESFLNTMIENKGDMKGFIVAEKETEEYIGQIDLFRFDWKNRSVEMGIVIGKTDLQSRGIGTEAIRLLQKFVFERLNLHRLELQVYDYNHRAQRCYIKCGFKEEGRLREKRFMKGKYVNVILMSILKSEYEKQTLGGLE